MRATRRFALLLTCQLAIPGAAVAGKPYAPHVEPADFKATVDNPFFPLVPGTVFRFSEKSGKTIGTNEVTVTRETKVVMGVPCIVVHDQVFEGTVLREDTFDWYAQDKQGNVWYFGEATKEISRSSKTSTEGSWEAGVDGAQPGIIMPGNPVVGEPYRQEYYRGIAEDMGQVVAVGDSVVVPFGSFAGCVRTREWSMLESGSERKWYAKGIGVVRTQSPENDIAELVEVIRP